jgi:hypothetical protein
MLFGGVPTTFTTIPKRAHQLEQTHRLLAPTRPMQTTETAKMLGPTVPLPLLGRADEVIERPPVSFDDLESHRKRLREAFGNTMSDEFVDLFLGKLVEALRPGSPCTNQFASAMNKWTAGIRLCLRLLGGGRFLAVAQTKSWGPKLRAPDPQNSFVTFQLRS